MCSGHPKSVGVLYNNLGGIVSQYLTTLQKIIDITDGKITKTLKKCVTKTASEYWVRVLRNAVNEITERKETKRAIR